MTQQSDVHYGQENLHEFFVDGVDGLFVGTSHEIMALGPMWRGLDGETLLHQAACRCELQWIRELVARGWNPEERSYRSGATPLQLLVMHHSYRENPSTGEECVAALLDLGAGIDTQDDDGDTALHYAASSNNTRAVDVLLKAGARVNVEGGSASTPLDCAVRGSSIEIVRLLVDAGADVNHRNESGGTPLIWSAACSPEIVRILLSAGADPRIRDNEGETAFDSASDCPEAAELIRTSLGGHDING